MTGWPTVLASVLDPQGPAAADIDDLWWLMFVLGVAVFLLFGGLLAAGLLRRRGRDPEPVERTDSARTWLVGGGVILPVVVVAIVLVATLSTMRAVPQEDDAAVTIEVIGHQWWWEVRYPHLGVVTANEIHIPAGEPVRLLLRSGDVIHSFWVPALAGKRDLLPEATTTLMIEADEPGRYEGVCAEFCGLQHTRMGMLVVADDAAGFDAWIDEHAADAAEPTTTEQQRGAAVFSSAGCGSCHTIRGTDPDGDDAPDLTHLATRRTLAGATISNTEENLREWVSDPHSIKQGVEMPAADVSEADLDALVAYLENLE